MPRADHGLVGMAPALCQFLDRRLFQAISGLPAAAGTGLISGSHGGSPSLHQPARQGLSGRTKEAAFAVLSPP